MKKPSPTDDKSLVRLAQALGHPARVAIVRLLRQRSACICGEIVGVLPLAQSTVSQHLKILKDAGWIQGSVDGPRVCYCLNPEAAKTFERLTGNLLGATEKHETQSTECAAGCKPGQTLPAATARSKKRARLVSRH